MGPVFLLLMVSVCYTQGITSNCTACDKSKCPPLLLRCYGSTAIDPCGCCEQCAKQKLEPCGGPNWELGYCDRQFKCAAITGLHPVEIPEIGVCKDLRDYSGIDHLEDDDDEGCPQKTYCYFDGNHFRGQTCKCFTKRACNLDFYAFHMQCGDYKRQEPEPSGCYNYGCDIRNNECVCHRKTCEYRFQYRNGDACYKDLIERLCNNVTCLEPKELQCPPDSVSTKPHIPLGKCCPSVPSYCTCDFDKCNYMCPQRRRKVMVQESEGVPGSCCDKFLCLL